MDLDKLYEPLPLKERRGQGNMVFKYIANEDVIDRMNKVFRGNWSAEVIYKEIVEDQVLVEVLVSANDPETDSHPRHSGFGSQQIMRYKDGPNSNKIIDISNGYKSALSKAIVSACTRFGVGLYKETWGAGPVGVSNPPNNPTVPPPPPANPAPVSPPAPAPTAAAPVVPNMPVSNSISVTQAPMANNPAPPPPAPNPVPVNTAPMPPNPAPAVNAVPATPEVPFADQNEGVSEFSDVQRVALNGILNMRGIKYEDLAKEAFEAKGITRPFPAKEDLNYEDAVVIIKYGNDKYRKTS